MSILDIRYIEVSSCQNCPFRRHFQGIGRVSPFETCAHQKVVATFGEEPFKRKLDNFPELPDFCPLRDLEQIVKDRFNVESISEK